LGKGLRKRVGIADIYIVRQIWVKKAHLFCLSKYNLVLKDEWVRDDSGKTKGISALYEKLK
jgi:hypothetical protein